MKTIEKHVALSQAEADAQAVIEQVTLGVPLDHEIASRVRQRSEQATEELRKKYGELEVAVELIREIRDEE